MAETEIAGLLSALTTAFYVGLFLCIAGGVLIAFHFLDEWKEEKDSPGGKIQRGRHFGGV